MNIYLLKAKYENQEFFGGYLPTNGISDEHKLFGSVNDSDLFVADLTNFDRIDVTMANLLSEQISKRIISGGVLLVFAGRIIDNGAGTNYSWIPWFKEYDFKLLPGEASRDFQFIKVMGITQKFQGKENLFKFSYFFSSKVGMPQLDIIGLSNSNDAIALYGKIQSGHIFILPTPNNIEEATKFFIEDVLPTMNLNFEITSGSREPIPDDISTLKFGKQESLIEKIRLQEEIIVKEQSKLAEINEEYQDLEQWKELLWQTGTPLENIVQKVFQELGLRLDKQEIDLVGDYGDQKVLIEVKGNTGCIDHRKDFRQILERYFDSENPEKTIALLIGNPYRLLPLDQRPPKNHSLFAETSIGLAKKNNIGLVPTMELYKIINDLKNGVKISKKVVLSKILKSSGIFDYKNNLKKEAS